MAAHPPFSIPISEDDLSPPRNETPVFRSVISPDALVHSPVPGEIHTLYDVLAYATRRFDKAPLFGTRKVEAIVEETKEVVKQGKTETKLWKFFQLSPYEWESYAEVRQKVLDVGSAMAHLGLRPNHDKMVIFAGTSADWMVMSHASFTQSITIATAYDTLGEEGLLHALNECEAAALFTNAELLPVVAKVAEKATHLTHVFYNGKANETHIQNVIQHNRQKVYSITELQELGKKFPMDPVPPQPEDLACIMYTSGSTGNPKGVLLSHTNLVAALGGVNQFLEFYTSEEDTIIAYLPLAHVLEFVVEHCAILWGVRLGFGSPKTLMDASVRNCRGDMRELRPTFMAGVPAVWDAIRKGVLAKLSTAGPIVQSIFYSSFNIKWQLMQMGLPTAWLDPVFQQVREQTGGRLRFALSGGAPISRESQKFLSVVVCPILQGYGMTESCGMCTVLAPEMFQLERAGANVPCVELKLVDCPEAGYTSNDWPNPRGEVWVRGPAVTSGYFKRPDVTADTFTPDGWLMTGDIGELHEDGTLSIVDRKKNLVKLSHGEYIALEKLESIYKSAHAVQNTCIIADSYHAKPVALVQPIEREIIRIGKRLGMDGVSYHDLCLMPEVRKTVLEEMILEGKSGGLKGAELIADCFLCDEEWSSQNGMLTAAQKLKRKEVQQKFQAQVNAMLDHLPK